MKIYTLNSTSVIIYNCVVTACENGMLSITPLTLYAKKGIDCSGIPQKTYGSKFNDSKMLSILSETGKYSDINNFNNFNNFNN